MRSIAPALVTGLFVALSGSSPASAAAVFVEINPSTARPGDEIALRASCDDNLQAATVTGEPIGSVTVSPGFGFLTATVRIPPGTGTGDYPLVLTCPGGADVTATLHVVAKVEPSRGPATGGGGTAPGAAGPVLISGGLTAIVAGLVLGLVSARRRAES